MPRPFVNFGDRGDARVLVDRSTPTRTSLWCSVWQKYGPLEELLRQDDVGPTVDRVRDEIDHLGDVLRAVGAACLLDDRENRSGVHDPRVRLGTCCVMQWMLPPPSRISRAGTPTTSRPENKVAIVASASSSRRGSSSGTITLPFAT